VASQVDDHAEVLLGDEAQGGLELRAAVAPKRPEHVAGEALTVGADKRHVAAIGGTKGRRIAEREREMLQTVDEPVEADHLGVGCIPVGKPQG
jgi:hypothetical protein